MTATLSAPSAATEAPVEIAPVATAASRHAGAWRRLLRRPTFVVAAVVVVGWIIAALVWPLLGLDPYGKTGALLAAPGPGHPLGTDNLGRDVLARTVAGADSALVVGPAGAILATLIGGTLGLIAGYFRGAVDTVFTRAFDVLAVLPPIIFIIVLVGAFGVSTPALIVIIGVVFAPGIARVIRATTLAETGKSYVASARLQGERPAGIIVGELLPNVFPTLVIQATLSLAAAIFMGASLSFLGLGSQPPSPDWGLVINENRIYLQSGWWSVVFPALAVASLVVAVHLIADNVKEVTE